MITITIRSHIYVLQCLNLRDSYIGFRISKKDKELILKICKDRDEDASGFIRRAVRKELARLSFLSDDEAKALGILKDQGEEQ